MLGLFLSYRMNTNSHIKTIKPNSLSHLSNYFNHFKAHLKDILRLLGWISLGRIYDPKNYITVTYRVQLIGVFIEALFIEIGKQISQHPHYLFRLNRTRISGKSSDVSKKKCGILKFINQRNSLTVGKKLSENLNIKDSFLHGLAINTSINCRISSFSVRGLFSD
jgi:hypothetical protein